MQVCSASQNIFKAAQAEPIPGRYGLSPYPTLSIITPSPLSQTYLKDPPCNNNTNVNKDTNLNWYPYIKDTNVNHFTYNIFTEHIFLYLAYLHWQRLTILSSHTIPVFVNYAHSFTGLDFESNALYWS